ncbi:hypothetical protein OVW19_27455, partial [Klebsiella pneumoniae]|uniref:hypothetical protein n=1 Tax=Klebsiella pneumoniae TaxID=573 RepID=UPI00226DF48B
CNDNRSTESGMGCFQLPAKPTPLKRFLPVLQTDERERERLWLTSSFLPPLSISSLLLLLLLLSCTATILVVLLHCCYTLVAIVVAFTVVVVVAIVD